MLTHIFSLLSWQVSVPQEALESFWMEICRKDWVVKLIMSSSTEELLQVLNILHIAKILLAHTHTHTHPYAKSVFFLLHFWHKYVMPNQFILNSDDLRFVLLLLLLLFYSVNDGVGEAFFHSFSQRKHTVIPTLFCFFQIFHGYAGFIFGGMYHCLLLPRI
jgi:hypothetical protein